MIRVCCDPEHVGPRVLGEIEPYDDVNITSAYCEVCFPRIMKNLEEQMIERKKNLLENHDGMTTVEYAILAAGIAAVIILGVSLLGPVVKSCFDLINSFWPAVGR